MSTTVALATGLTSPLVSEAGATITTEAGTALLAMDNSANHATVAVVSGIQTTVVVVSG